MLIPKFSWWYYKSIADEVNGRTLQYPDVYKRQTYYDPYFLKYIGNNPYVITVHDLHLTIYCLR